MKLGSLKSNPLLEVHAINPFDLDVLGITKRTCSPDFDSVFKFLSPLLVGNSASILNTNQRITRNICCINTMDYHAPVGVHNAMPSLLHVNVKLPHIQEDFSDIVNEILKDKDSRFSRQLSTYGVHSEDIEHIKQTTPMYLMYCTFDLVRSLAARENSEQRGQLTPKEMRLYDLLTLDNYDSIPKCHTSAISIPIRDIDWSECENRALHKLVTGDTINFHIDTNAKDLRVRITLPAEDYSTQKGKLQDYNTVLKRFMIDGIFDESPQSSFDRLGINVNNSITTCERNPFMDNLRDQLTCLKFWKEIIEGTKEDLKPKLIESDTGTLGVYDIDLGVILTSFEELATKLAPHILETFINDVDEFHAFLNSSKILTKFFNENHIVQNVYREFNTHKQLTLINNNKNLGSSVYNYLNLSDTGFKTVNNILIQELRSTREFQEKLQKDHNIPGLEVGVLTLSAMITSLIDIRGLLYASIYSNLNMARDSIESYSYMACRVFQSSTSNFSEDEITTERKKFTDYANKSLAQIYLTNTIVRLHDSLLSYIIHLLQLILRDIFRKINIEAVSDSKALLNAIDLQT